MNNNSYEYFDIEYVIPIIKLECGLDANVFEVKDIAIHTLKRIGNIWNERYLFIGKIKDNQVEIPCNVAHIESVTLTNENYNSYVNIADWANQQVPGRFVDSVAYSSAFSQLPNRTSSGSFKDYRFVIENGEKFLRFNRIIVTEDVTLQNQYNADMKGLDNLFVNVLYDGQIVSSEGLPMITEKEAFAIAYQWIYLDYRKKAMVGMNNGALMQEFKNNYVKYVNLARQPNKLNQNLMDEIMDIKTSFNMKWHGKDFKYKNS